MGEAFVALKRGRGQGGFEGASPQRAATENPTQPPASFQCNPEGWMRLGRLSALLARARPLRVLPLHSRLEIRPNRFQQRPLPFNQWFLYADRRRFWETRFRPGWTAGITPGSSRQCGSRRGRRRGCGGTRWRRLRRGRGEPRRPGPWRLRASC